MEEMNKPLEQEELSDLTEQQEIDASEIADAAEEIPVEEPVTEEKPEKKEEKPKKKWTAGKIWAIVLGAIALNVLLVVCLMLVFKGAITKAIQEDPTLAQQIEQLQEKTENKTDAEADNTPSHVDMDALQSTSSYAYTDESLSEKYNAEIIARVGDHELNGAMFQIFYWSMVYNYLNTNSQYTSYLGPDVSTPLSEQNYGEDTTWEQYFLEMALETYLQNVALYEEGVAHGVTLSEEAEANLAAMPDDLAAQAEEYGFDTVDAYLCQSFGPCVTLDDYMDYYRLYTTAVAYADVLQNDITVTPEEAEAFYDENADSYVQQGIDKIDQNVVNVRHILIQPEKDIDTDDDLTPDDSSDEAWAAAEKSAQEVYDNWKLDPTEENFGKQAASASSDTGSAENGGLYEGVYPGQMVAEFNDWCFDAARKPGDTGIVRTSFGYHIMYFVGTGDVVFWRSQAEYDCKYDKFDAILDEIFGKYTLDTDYSKLHIYDIIAFNAAQNAAATEEIVESIQ